MPEVAVSVAAGLRIATARLRSAGCETPRLDAEVLLAHALGCDRSALVVRAREELSDGAGFEALVSRRAAREPVAYILGRKPFRSIDLAVDSRVLIPRPETELLVEAALTLPLGARVADVGTGSGAVALALALERPDLEVVGIDVAAGAIAVARANAARLGSDVEFVLADLLDVRAYDAVLANLPYVADGSPLAPEIALYEPADALFAGAEGLDVIGRLVAVAGRREIGWLALEVGFGQAAAVSELLRGAGFASVERRHDLAGHERVLVATR